MKVLFTETELQRRLGQGRVRRKIDEEKLNKLFNELKTLSSETEWVEFKEAKSSFSFKELGQYFSALSNEANLKGQPYGWLIFGVSDKTRKIVGTINYRMGRESEEE